MAPTSPAAILRDARRRAPQDEVGGCGGENRRVGKAQACPPFSVILSIDGGHGANAPFAHPTKSGCAETVLWRGSARDIVARSRPSTRRRCRGLRASARRPSPRPIPHCPI